MMGTAATTHLLTLAVLEALACRPCGSDSKSWVELCRSKIRESAGSWCGPGCRWRKRGVEMIRVLLVEDQTLVREGLEKLLGLTDDIMVVERAVDGAEALEKLRQFDPDVILL